MFSVSSTSDQSTVQLVLMGTAALSMRDQYLLDLGLRSTEVWTKVKVSKVIDHINSSSKESLDYCDVNEFSVSNQCNNLMLNRITQDYGFKNVLKFIPCVDAFDIIWVAHTADNVHRTLIETMRILRIEHYVELINVKSVIDLCTFCKSQKFEPSFNKNCAVMFLDMSTKPDQDFKYLLIYEDLHTGLVQLRPLVSLDNVDICMELYKIFADFGVPENLRVSEQNFFYQAFMEMLNKCRQYFTTKEMKMTYRRSSSRWVKHLGVLLNMLMFDLNVTNWAMLCYTLQWRINNTNFCDQSPHNMTFKNKVHENEVFHKRPAEVKSKEISNYLNNDLDSTDDFSSLSDSDCCEVVETKRKFEIVLLRTKSTTSQSSNVAPPAKRPIHCEGCNRIIDTKVYYCKNCKCCLHSFCGVRVANSSSKNKSAQIVCKICED